MSKTYIGLAFSISMLPPGAVTFSAEKVTPEEVKETIEGKYVSTCNFRHTSTLKALESRFGIAVSVPEKPPRVSLFPGDVMIVLQIAGLPRLTEAREYTAEEVDKAEFQFKRIEVLNA